MSTKQTALMLSLTQADITTLQVDAIVNAANNSLLGGGGVDGAIHRAAGSHLLSACRRCNGCPTGQARITPGFDLHADYIIHAVGPIWQGGNAGESDLLRLCYENSLGLARAHGCESIAFPAISCGAYGYPLAQAAHVAVNSCRQFCQDYPGIKQIQFVVFDTVAANNYRWLLEDN